jgi:hypothetical protein
MHGIFCFFTAWSVCFAAVFSARAGEPEKYTLRYKFHPGETIRWEVEHRSNVRATVSGTTKKTETLSISVKQWRVTDVRSDGAATFEHSVEWIDMRQKLTGSPEVRYNSRTDANPPVGFEDAAKLVGVKLSVVTIDAVGKVLHHDRIKAKPQAASSSWGGSSTAAPTGANPTSGQSDGWMTIPLPEEPVPVGHTWSLPQYIDIPLPSGGTKRIKAIQQFTLEDVKTGVATIQVSTEILTPITDPAIESQLIQREAAGRVRLDIDAGRVMGQQMDIDKHVVGFRGGASSIHYVNRFSERLLPEQVRTAEKDGKRD